jgi:hypothetical protein
MDAGLVLEPAVRVAAAHLERDLFEPAQVRGRGRDHLRLPTVALREPAVHLEQVAGPQRRLLSAGAGADLDDDVLPLARVLRDEGRLEPGAELGGLFVEPRGLVGEERGHLGIGLRRGELPRLPRLGTRRLVLAVRHDDRVELGESTAEVAQSLRVARHVG